MFRSDKKWETLFYYKKQEIKRYGMCVTGYGTHVGKHKFRDGNALGIAPTTNDWVGVVRGVPEDISVILVVPGATVFLLSLC